MPMAMMMWKAMKMATAMTVSGCCWLDRRMGLVAIVLLAKRLIDIIRVVDNSLLAGLRHSLGRWRGLQPKMGLKRSHAFWALFRGKSILWVRQSLSASVLQRYKMPIVCNINIIKIIDVISVFPLFPFKPPDLCGGCAFKKTLEEATSAAIRCWCWCWVASAIMCWCCSAF